MSPAQFRFSEPPSRQCPEIRVALSHFLNQVQSGHVETMHQAPRLLHWDSIGERLEEFAWPMDPDTGLRILPSQLESFRRTHTFRGPSCLCAFIDIENYTETRIGIVEVVSDAASNDHSTPKGEYVAACAKQRCGYVLCLERFYPVSDLKTRFYFERDSPLSPQDLLHVSDLDKSFRRSDGLFQAMTGGIIRGKGRRLLSMSPQEAWEPKDILITDLTKGISETRFWSLFVQCLICRQVMFKDTMSTTHICDLAKPLGHRYEPYPTRSGRPRVIQARLSCIPGDCPESPGLCSLRSSPTPTEVDDCQTQRDEGENTSYDEADDQPQASPSHIPAGTRSVSPIPSSDFDMPSLLELSQSNRAI